MKHPLSRAFGALLLLPLLVACGGDDDPTGPDSLAGTYALVEVNGEEPPAEITVTDPESGLEATIRLLDGSLRLDDGEFASDLDVEFYLNGELVPELSGNYAADGTYEVDGTSITFTTVQDGETITNHGVLEGRRITLTQAEPGLGVVAEFVYSR